MGINMDDNQNKEEINLQEIITILWKNKFIILSIILVTTILAGIYSICYLSPVYHSRFNLIIDIPKTYSTPNGDYTLPVLKNNQYIDLITSNTVIIKTLEDMGYGDNEMTVNQLQSSIVIDAINENNFVISMAADNAEEAKKLADIIYNAYLEFIDVMTAENAANYLSSAYSVRIDTLNKRLDIAKLKLKNREELLSELSLTMLQNEDLNKIGELINADSIINPNYTRLEGDIISNKQTINYIENSIQVHQDYLKELELIIEAIDQYHDTGDFGLLEDKIVRISKSSISLASPPMVPSQKSGPNILKYIITGAFMGGALSVLLALIKGFWFTKNKYL